MDNIMKATEALPFQLSKANKPRYGSYQTTSAYAIQANHPTPHTPRNIPPPNAPSGPAYNQPGPNYQQYPRQGLGPCIYCDELGHIRTFCPNVHTDREQGIVYLNYRGRLILGPRGKNGGEISGYWLERRFLSMQEYARKVTWQGQ